MAYRFFVYMLASKRNGTLYVGVTNDLARRVLEHRSRVGVGFARRYDVTRLVWFEEPRYIAEAIQRERASRSGNAPGSSR